MKPQEPKEARELPEHLKKRKEEVERAMGHRKNDTKDKPKTPELKKPVTPIKKQPDAEVKKVPLTGKSPRQIVKKELQ